MKHLRERALMAIVLLALPALFLGLGILPVIRRSEKLRAEIQANHEEYKAIPRFSPLTKAEQELLGDDRAPWRSRMPLVVGDRARLAHYHQVVSGLQVILKSSGIPSSAMRSSWDPIKASFSVPGEMAGEAAEVPTSLDAPELKVDGWVLEAEIPGTTSQLFKALTAVHRVQPILEPVGLRWEATPAFREQKLLFRNLVLVP